MAPYLKLIPSQTPSGLSSSSQITAQALLEKLEAKNKSTLEEIATKLEEAEKTEGETEISDALRAKANYLTKIGNKVCIMASLNDTKDAMMNALFTSASSDSGCLRGGSEACINEDTGSRGKNRPNPYPCASGAFL